MISHFKKVLACVAALVLLCAVAGCASSTTAEEPVQIEKHTLTVKVAGPADAPDSSVLITVTQEGRAEYASYARVNGSDINFYVAPGTWTVQVSDMTQTSDHVAIYKTVANYPVEIQSSDVGSVVSLEYTDEYKAIIYPETTNTNTWQQGW